MGSEEMNMIVKELGYSSVGVFFESTGLGHRSKAVRLKKNGESDPWLGGLLRLLKKSSGQVDDTNRQSILLGSLLGVSSLFSYVIRDDFTAPAFNAGDIILAEPYKGETPVDGNWIIQYQNKEAFGRLMVMPDGVWRFSRIGNGTEPIIFGAEHKETISLVGRALYHIKKIGA